MMAMPAIDDLIDTWPLASLVEDARQKWTDGPDGFSLAVLARCAQVVAGVLGFPQVIDGRWPMPDVEWIEQMAGPGPHLVVGRGPRDGAPAMAVVLRTRVGGREPVPTPPTIEAHGDTFVDELPNLLAGIERGDGVAIRFETPHKWDAASMEGMETVRQAAPAQWAFERYGTAGLICPDAPDWHEMLERAPAGVRGDVLKTACNVLILPTLTEEGEVDVFGALCWDGPYQPIRVINSAAEVLRRLDGKKTMADLATELHAREATVKNLLDQLVDIGAATAAT